MTTGLQRRLADAAARAGRALAARWDRWMSIAALGFVLALCIPSPPVRSVPELQPVALWVRWVEDQGRFVNTALQVAMPLITRDILGLKSLVWITVTGTSATHGLKRALNEVEVDGVRLGQRPTGKNSRHNFPSGHSSLASSGAVFVAARYGKLWLLLLLPMTLAVMYTRVALEAHTWSAVVAGACLGVLFTLPFCRKAPVTAQPPQPVPPGPTGPQAGAARNEPGAGG